MKFYKDIYNTLYEAGYHKDIEYCHSKPLCDYLEENYEFNSILDIGCSHGWVLRRFNKKNAWGVDVADRAVKVARDLGGNAVLASATSLPFPDKQFDVVHSTDMMEHLKPEDVEKAVSEARRVCKKYLALKIATRVDQANWKEKVGHDLHLTIEPIQWWISKFKQRGDKLNHISNDTFIVEICSSTNTI